MPRFKRRKHKKRRDENTLNKKDENIKKQEVQNKDEDPKEIIHQVSKKWFMTIPKSSKDRLIDPVYNSFEKTFDRTIIPNNLDIKLKDLKSYIRYKGSLIGIFHKSLFFNHSFLLVCLYTNEVKHTITITKKGDTLKNYPPDLPLQDKFHLLYDINIVTPDNQKIFKDCIDAFVQKRLIEMEYTFNTLDMIMINKSGIFMTLEKINTFEDLDNAISILFVLVDNLGGY